MNELTFYNSARNALQQASSVDEVKTIKDKAEAIRLYAQQQRDEDLEKWASAIKTRAFRRMGELISELETGKAVGKGQVLPSGGKYKHEVLDEADISTSTAHRAEQLAKIPLDVFEKGANEGLSASKILALAKKEENASLPKLITPEGEYDVIVIDPPWPMEKIERDDAPNQFAFDYPTMSLEEISDMAIPAAENCHLFCWTTQKFLPATLEILKCWGFRYVLTMVWHKNGGFQPFGLPQYNCEFLVYARKGTPKFIDTKAFNCCFNAPRGQHSEKPKEIYDVLSRVTDGKRIDMFSRQVRNGFEGWGNEHGKL